MALFRSETEEARANAWLGRILLLRPLSFTLLTAAALAVALALAALFIWGEYTRKARVTGVLAPRQGVTKVLAQQAGFTHVPQPDLAVVARARGAQAVARGV